MFACTLLKYTENVYSCGCVKYTDHWADNRGWQVTPWREWLRAERIISSIIFPSTNLIMSTLQNPNIRLAGISNNNNSNLFYIIIKRLLLSHITLISKTIEKHIEILRETQVIRLPLRGDNVTHPRWQSCEIWRSCMNFQQYMLVPCVRLNYFFTAVPRLDDSLPERRFGTYCNVGWQWVYM